LDLQRIVVFPGVLKRAILPLVMIAQPTEVQAFLGDFQSLLATLREL
jgi:hypothetical protein